MKGQARSAGVTLREGSVRVGAHGIAYTHGRPTAPDAAAKDAPFVLLHGWAASRGIWRDVQPILAARRSTWAFDLPGFGASGGGGEGHRPRDLARGVVEAGRAVAGDRVVLVGHSLGAIVALAAALDAPDWVDALVLLTPPEPDDVAARIRPLRHDAVAVPVAWLFYTWARFAKWRGHEHGPLGDLSTRRALHAGTRPQTLIATLRALPEADAYARAPRVAAPTLVVVGGSDASTPPASGRRLAARIGGAEVVEVPGARHHLMADAPHELAAAVESWVRGLTGDPRRGASRDRGGTGPPGREVAASARTPAT